MGWIVYEFLRSADELLRPHVWHHLLGLVSGLLVEPRYDAHVGIVKHLRGRVSKQLILECGLCQRMAELIVSKLLFVSDMCELRTMQQLQLVQHVCILRAVVRMRIIVWLLVV